MRQTLVEVLGEDEGTSLYTMDWLIQRVHWHLDPDQATASVFIAEDTRGTIVGHTIVRKDRDDLQQEIGLFSTTFVDPDFRRAGVAAKLLEEGENWILENGLLDSETHTAKDNLKLIQLFRKNGYTQSPGENQMVILRKKLEATTEPLSKN
jgi:GNAT superfamily N-acetyltransferase